MLSKMVIYCGKKVVIIDIFTKKQRFLPEEEWVMYKDETGEIVPAIVSEELWEAAKRVYRMRSNMVKGRKSSCKKENYFTGKLYCAEHQVPYWLKAKTDRSGNADGTWISSHRLKNGSHSCDSVPLKDHELLQVLEDVLQDITDDFKTVAEQYLQIYEKIAKADNQEADIEKLKKELEQIERKKDKLLEYNLAEQITDKEYLRRNALLNEDAEKIEEKLTEIERKRTNAESWMKEMRRMKRELQEYGGITAEDFTQGIIDLLIDKIYISPVSGQGEDTIDLRILLNTGEPCEKMYQLKKAVKKIDAFPIGKAWIFVPSVIEKTLSATGSNVATFTAISVGDVDGSYPGDAE